MTPLYDRPVWQLLGDALAALPETFTTEDAIAWFERHYPRVHHMTVRMHLRAACVNLPPDPYHRDPPAERRVLYRLDRARYTRYRPEVHGIFGAEGAAALGIAEDDAPPYVVDGETPSQFALEAHLEEFMAENWSRLDFGAPLTIWSGPDGQHGRQYETDVGRIDFLCRDARTGEFWVIELKRGRSSDAAVGQVLRYMGWVQQHLAGEARVRGLIVTAEQEPRLGYALKMVPNVEAWTYRVSFEFHRGLPA